MLDPELQQRFMRSCAEAAFGYSAASTATCAAFADQVLNFWTSVLQPTPPKREPELWRWPSPVAAPTPAQLNPFFWALPQAAPPPKRPPATGLPTNPWEAMAQFADAVSSALSTVDTVPVKPVAGPGNPMAAWLSAFPFSPPSPAWPMAFMMMSQGVPHAVAWPTAEANVAVLDAADTARRSIKKAFASYQTETGHAAGGNAWPPVEMLTLLAIVPLNIGTMLAAMRLH